MNRAWVDFNSLGRGGKVRAHCRRAELPPIQGERLVAVDLAEGIWHHATVESVEGDFMWLELESGQYRWPSTWGTAGRSTLEAT